jgi:hypothetical protein
MRLQRFDECFLVEAVPVERAQERDVDRRPPVTDRYFGE